ncbi:MAG: patatin-like phospholipase family protein [Candidatus Nealsonbacteria bacterium DGGOD1a]|jgi:Predicted esterase of the alpha-beta hydrolase superfamily|nr:MAG: patatin-like phospholipase family protein [Candidatus Nealsonbacteria bacterium DGGOD1a]
MTNKKIGLALSGGGALGVAHIGAIEEIEKSGIKINFVCGTSAGAIIGLAYAIGGLETLHRFYDDAIGNFGKKNKLLFAKGADGALEYIQLALAELCKGKKFDQLAIPFSCCATNLATGEREVFNSGDPVAAVMASSAYPGVFAAREIGGKFYIDGGATRNLPAGEARAAGAEFVIGSSIYAVDRIDDEKAGKINRIEIAARAMDIIQKELSGFEERQCDFCFKPAVASFKWFDFFIMEKIAAQGRENAAKQIQNLLLAIKK